MRGKISTILTLSLLVLAVASCGCAESTGQQAVPNSSFVLQNSDTVQITDMLGRQLTVPEKISSVVATSPPSTILVYMLTPDKLAGWNFKNNFPNLLWMKTTQVCP
jgi:iron complex transport system substrate-binding protein